MLGKENLSIDLASLNRKNFTSLTPLDVALKALTFALNDSAEAFVDISKEFRIDK